MSRYLTKKEIEDYLNAKKKPDFNWLGFLISILILGNIVLWGAVLIVKAINWLF